MDPFLEKLDGYYRRNRGKKISEAYRILLQKDPDSLNEQERQIYNSRIQPHREYFIGMLEGAFEEEGRPIDEWRELLMASPQTIIAQMARRVIIRAMQL
ncbi:MAG: hypothetical protein ACYC55_08115 [Candidatus Geothermincolia bacterium]